MSEINQPARRLIDFQDDRDATFKLIDWFDIERVHSAKVLVIGAGAIGNEALKNLALLGFGNIMIIDRDTIEISNLSRSILYRAADAGKSKASTAAKAVREINPNVNVRSQDGDIRFDLGLGLLRQMDVIIGCVDNRNARIYINRACQKVDRPWVDAGIGQLNGQIRVFQPGNGACYECSFSDADYQDLSVSCNQLASRYSSEGKVPTTPTIASIAGAVQAQEALKLLNPDRWTGRTLAGREFIFNGTVGQAGVTEIPVRHDCPAHLQIDSGSIVPLHEASAKTTTVNQLLSMIRKYLGSDAVLILNFELAVAMRCFRCQGYIPVLRPLPKMVREELMCERCDRQRSLITTHCLGQPTEEYETDFFDSPLADIGIPMFDILEGRGSGGTNMYFELSRDAADFTVREYGT